MIAGLHLSRASAIITVSLGLEKNCTRTEEHDQ